MAPMLVAISVELDVGLAEVVSAVGAYFFAYGLMQPVWGVAASRIGLARTVLLCTIAGSLASLASAMATGLTALVICRVLAGGLFSANIPVGLTYVGTVATDGNRQESISRLMVGLALGTTSATAVSGVLAEHISWRAVLIMSSIMGLAASLVIRRLPELPRQPFGSPVLRPVGAVLSSRWALALFTMAVLDGAAILGALTFAPAAIASSGVSVSWAAALTAVYGLTVVAVAPVVGWLSHRVAASTIIAAGAAAGVAGCLILSVSTTPVPAIMGCGLIGVTWASLHASLQSWATEAAPQQRSIAVSLFAGSLFLGSGLGAAVGGPWADAGRFSVLFITAAGTLLALGVVASTARRRWDRDRGGSPGPTADL